MIRFIRPTAVVSLFMAAIVVLSGCTTSESEVTTSVSPSPAVTSTSAPSSAPSQSRGGDVIKQVLDGYELPAEEVVFMGAHLADGVLTYNFQLGEDAYQKYALRVGQSADESDTYVTTLKESAWLETDQVKATVQGVPKNVAVICKISARPWVPAAGGHVPPVSRT